MIGEVIDGKYRIIEVIGAGGMSLVFKAEHLLLNRTVAVKMLHAYLRSDDVSVKRFQQEAKTCASFDHPNVVPILDFGVTRTGQPFLVMKYLDGISLARMLRQRHRLPWREAVPIFIQCCDGLEAAHAAGIIHRDIKPGNIVVITDPDGSERVQVVDFGIAKMLNDDLNEQRLTQAGEVFGSPLYMSPEQCEGAMLDSRSDIYSLGAVMYETLSGVPPLMGGSATETMRLHAHVAPRPFSVVAEGLTLPAKLEEIVQTMLAKRPSARFSTMAAVRRELWELIDIGSRQQSASPPALNRGAIVAATLSLLILVGTFVYMQGFPLLRHYRLESMISSAEKDLLDGKAVPAVKTLNAALDVAKQIKDHGASESRVLALLSSTYERQGKAAEADNIDKLREALIKREVMQQYGSADVQKLADDASTPGADKIEAAHGTEYYRQRVNDLENASILLLNNKDAARAERSARRAMEIQRKVFGENDPVLVRLQRQLGKVYLETRDFRSASDCFSRAMKLAATKPNPQKMQVIKFALLGEELARHGIYDGSENCYLTSVNFAAQLPPDDPCVPAILRSFANVLKADGKEAIAKTMITRAEARERKAAQCSKPPGRNDL